MENTHTGNGLYGTFKVTVDDRELAVAPNFSHNEIYYRVSEGDKFLFTLKLAENAEWKAQGDEFDATLVKKVGAAIEKLKA